MGPPPWSWEGRQKSRDVDRASELVSGMERNGQQAPGQQDWLDRAAGVLKIIITDWATQSKTWFLRNDWSLSAFLWPLIGDRLAAGQQRIRRGRAALHLDGNGTGGEAAVSI
ncbi:hypothetical protein VTN96DRAFT_2901 [Rasamsonia emersonii]